MKKITNASKLEAAFRVPRVGTVAYGETVEVEDDYADALIEGGQFKAAAFPTKKTPKAEKAKEIDR